jgi:hypothetical protein
MGHHRRGREDRGGVRAGVSSYPFSVSEGHTRRTPLIAESEVTGDAPPMSVS